eukprot:CAMPEP_0114230624 /NCGR_PEP_ID=MMETSP0058-20121206/3574_1 /TAXON_ID=36894 /ORGANISM="Pyramimonas parkeae, CCMP726" /LENGTH=127 /DNA_ID=CAMNT_0001341847 /DNA_START=1597 /DNA_END=1980 /DNA_ORIENTATION=-
MSYKHPKKQSAQMLGAPHNSLSFPNYSFAAEHLPQTAGLALRLHEGENVTLAHGALHVAHDLTVLVVQELHAYLGHLTARTGAANDLHDDGKLHRGVLKQRFDCHNSDSGTIMDTTYQKNMVNKSRT